MASFSFGFSGDDIEEDQQAAPEAGHTKDQQGVNGASGQPQTSPAAGAFPVAGKPLLPPAQHSLPEMLAKLPSKISYSTLDVDLDGKRIVQLPRRELWDVKLQLMAEEDGEDATELQPGLGNHDVRTGIYEGGFKSWESSVDLVKTLPADLEVEVRGKCLRVVELGCGTALPSLALFQAAMMMDMVQSDSQLSLVLADYNPSVLYLVTLPNLLLTWALGHQDRKPLLREALATEGELELTDETKRAFQHFLIETNITLSFMSGGWSQDFVDLLYSPEVVPTPLREGNLLVLGAETIYSPFALSSFAELVLSMLRREKSERPGHRALALVAAKKLYFGVGGSLDDFVDMMRASGTVVQTLREEAGGIRRGVVSCAFE